MNDETATWTGSDPDERCYIHSAAAKDRELVCAVAAVKTHIGFHGRSLRRNRKSVEE